MTTPNELQPIKARFGIIGNSSALNYAIQVAIQVASTDLTVLITGESGSGKESFSKIIHNLSYRKHGQFIAINCGAIPEGTIDSELFGHEKGSFTGAIDARRGYFEVTDGGTIFLDEVAEMPLGTQARLLRVLESGEFIRVGSSKVQKTNVRVIAATNINLLKAVEKGRFREDLYYRLNTVPIIVPPLRERGRDIELLFRKFATDFAEKHRIEPITLTEDAQSLLISYAFPGNIRQLKNIAEQISILQSEKKRTIDAAILQKYLPENQKSSLPVYLGQTQNDSVLLTDRELLYRVLFDMKRDMNEMKQLIIKILENEKYGKDFLKTYESLLDSSPMEFKTLLPNTNSVYTSESPSIIKVVEKQRTDDNSIEDIPHETQNDESFVLEKQEKEMIIRALRKNRFKRKYAALDLGISERTLYRKIKEYNIDDD